ELHLPGPDGLRASLTLLDTSADLQLCAADGAEGDASLGHVPRLAGHGVTEVPEGAEHDFRLDVQRLAHVDAIGHLGSDLDTPRVGWLQARNNCGACDAELLLGIGKADARREAPWTRLLLAGQAGIERFAIGGAAGDGVGKSPSRARIQR